MCGVRTQVDLLGVAVGLEGFGNTQNSLCGVAVSKSHFEACAKLYIHPMPWLVFHMFHVRSSASVHLLEVPGELATTPKQLGRCS
jgi:hypothetical protein